jgi:L-cystine uptake protein TcyP (sodium:dicarboxylate symporter family)
VEIYNRVNTLIHYLLPFCIQTIAITLLIVLAARSRAKAARNQKTFRQVLKKQISTQKELYVTPFTIILSLLPQAVLSFSFACTRLNNWKQHTLIVCVLISYVPQILGFILYVLPSSAYKKQFGETGMGEKTLKWMFKTNIKKTNA